MTEAKPTFQWHANPSWELADQMHFSKELLAGSITARDIVCHPHLPSLWQEAAGTWRKTPDEMREAVRAYGRWLIEVADHDHNTSGNHSSDHRDDTDGM